MDANPERGLINHETALNQYVNSIQHFSKKEQILALRKRGSSVADICRLVDTSENYVRDVVRQAMEEARVNIAQHSEEIFAFDVMRVDSLIDRMMMDGLDGDHKAINSLVKLWKVKLNLIGQSQPKQINLSVDGEVNHTIEPVFTVNSPDFAHLMNRLQENPQLAEGHTDRSFDDIRERLELLNRKVGSIDVEEVIEGIVNEADNNTEDDE